MHFKNYSSKFYPVGPLLSGHPPLNGHFLKSRIIWPSKAVFNTSIQRPPLLSDRGHLFANAKVLFSAFFARLLSGQQIIFSSETVTGRRNEKSRAAICIKGTKLLHPDIYAHKNCTHFRRDATSRDGANWRTNRTSFVFVDSELCLSFQCLNFRFIWRW